MVECRRSDPDAGEADPRMAGYMEGRHSPREALAERVSFVAIHETKVIGYIAGHRTTRMGYDGEVQHLFVAPDHRRSGVATQLLQKLAGWFKAQGIRRVCVNVDADSPSAAPFYSSAGAKPLNSYWYAWDNILHSGA
jgi:GNAT superfamily N-acetyltransferase